VGGSCALEVAVAAPDRVAALVLIGTKAKHSPDPIGHASVLETLHKKGLDEAWRSFWAPLFSDTAPDRMVNDAKSIFLRQSLEDVARGVTVFHTRPSRDDFLARFTRPVVIVSGADDKAPGPKLSAAQANAAPQGSLHVIPNCGHYVPLEQPEHLNSILRRLIAAQC
jgi:pimeloyl-ACP methyl ester carboxylesterase